MRLFQLKFPKQRPYQVVANRFGALMQKNLLLLLLMSWISLPAKAQVDSLHYSGQLFYAGANNSLLPHWIASNRYGIFDGSKKNDGVFLLGTSLPIYIGSKIKLEPKVQALLRPDLSESYLHQIYLDAYYGKFQIKIGKEAYTLTDYNEKLSSGSFFLSNNAQPIPKLGVGFYDYTPVPFTKGFLDFKAIFNIGKLDDDRLPDGVDNPWFHEKLLYLRTAKLAINPHVGIDHSVIFGGTNPNGTKIPVDLLASIFAKPSSKIGGGEEANTAGAHFGLYDFGLDWDLWGAHYQFYFQQPFSDGSGQKVFTNRDNITGLNIQWKGKKLVSGFLYEFVNTKYQSGAGMPDPIVNGKFIKLRNVADLDQFMLDNFDIVTNGITYEEVGKYLEQNLNYGHKFGGRDDYYNNYLYLRGLSYHRYSIGTSLFLTRDRLKAFNPGFNAQYDEYFVSNRVVAHHFGIDGWLAGNLSYRALLTYTHNFGTYSGLNKGRFKWASMDPNDNYEYYFKNGLKEVYSLIEFNYVPEKLKGFAFTGSMAYDFGQMYHDFGIMLGVKYSNFLALKKKDKKH